MQSKPPKVEDFIKWALTHADLKTVPLKATLPIAREECGVEPWHYLFGSTRVRTTKSNLNYYYNRHYSKQMTREKYDRITADWKPTDYATDCQGLLDAYLTFEYGEKTDTNANGNYKNWCDEKGKIDEIERPFVLGEAVFMGSDSRKTHVGWVCGYDENGDLLVVEARNINYGVVITKLDDRPWVYRGLMTKRFEYPDEPINPADAPTPFAVVSPMYRGEDYRAMQTALNACHYTDMEGKPLEEDGKWGKRSQSAFDKLISYNKEGE